MNDSNPQHAAPSALPPNIYVRFTIALLLVPVLAMVYVSLALIIPPLQVNAVIFAALPAAPQWLQIEWYAATLIGLYALFAFSSKRLLPGLIATLVLAAAYVHLHLALLDNLPATAWLAVAAAVCAVIGAMRGQLR